MALAPADFYAYSRATGVPVPEDPEERAEMAPEVLAFRRNQLKAPESQGPDPLSIGIGLGLAAAGLGGAAFGLNRLFRGAGKGQTTTPAGANLVDLTKLVEARIPEVPKQTTPPQSKPYTFVSDKYEEVPFPDVNRTSRVQPPTSDLDVPPADERAQSFVQAAVDDLVSSHQQEIPIIAENTLDSLESGSDQLDAKLESVVQRDIDSVRYSKPIVAVEKYTDAVDKLTSSQERLMMEFGQYGAPKTDLNDPATSLKRAGYQFEMNDWSDGPPESVLDDLGNFLRQEEMRNQRMRPDAFNLSGARGDLPGVSEMSLKERKRYGKQIGLDLRPSKDQDPTEFFGDVDTSDFEGPVQGPSIGEYRKPAKITEPSKPVISKIEIADRISAAANYADGSLERRLLLNPLVPTERVRGLLGSALRVEQGRVGRNLTHEITPGARASMTEVPGWKDEQAARRAQMTEEVVYDEYAGDTPQVQTMSWEDYESSTDLGEGEGPGGLTLSRTFDERTGKSRTDLPGQYHLAYGGPQSPRAVRPLAGANQELYARQERIDRVMPTRSTEEGDTSRGFRVDPQTGRLVFEGASERDPMGRLRPTDPTMMAEGDYEDRLTTKLTGGFQAATGEPSPMVSTQPATAYYDKALKGKADPRLVRGSDGKLYVKSSQTQVTGEEPLVAFVGKRTTNPDGSQGAYVFLEKQGTKNISLPLNMLTEIVQDAKDTYLNNPSAKKEFLARRYPEQLEQGMAEGKLLNEMGDAISYNDFLIESLDKGLQLRGYKLPVLQQSNKGYYPKAAHEFISNVGQVTKESPVFGRPALIGPKGGVVYENTKYGKVPAVDKTRDAQPIPGLLDIRGTGGVDAMSIAEDYEGGVAFHAPRIETAPQVVRQRSTGNVLTATQAAQSPGGLLSTGETVPQLTPNPRPQFTVYPNVALRTIKTPDFSYVATEFLPPVQLEVKVDPETGRRYQTSNVLSQEKTVDRPYKAPSQSTASSLGMTGQQLANLRLQMETKPTGYTAPYLSNIGGGFIANTKAPFSSNAFYASGPVGGTLPQGGYVQLGEPTLTRFGYLSRNERGVGASRNLNLGMGAQPTVERPVSGFESPRTEEVSTYNIGQAMKQLMAQAGRRRGSRKS